MLTLIAALNALGYQECKEFQSLEPKGLCGWPCEPRRLHQNWATPADSLLQLASLLRLASLMRIASLVRMASLMRMASLTHVGLTDACWPHECNPLTRLPIGRGGPMVLEDSPTYHHRPAPKCIGEASS